MWVCVGLCVYAYAKWCPGLRVWLVSMSISCSVERCESRSAFVVVLHLACIMSRIPCGRCVWAGAWWLLFVCLYNPG